MTSMVSNEETFESQCQSSKAVSLLCEMKNLSIHEDQFPVMGNPGVAGIPQFEVFSITLEPNTNSTIDLRQQPWEIYGAMHFHGLIDGRTILYNLSISNAEKMSKQDSNGNFPLTKLYPVCFYRFFPAFHFFVNLCDRSHNIAIIKDTFYIDLKDFTDFDKVVCARFKGQNATLCMKYIIYRAAVSTKIIVTLKKNVDKTKTGDSTEVHLEKLLCKSDTVDISGTISASCYNNSNQFSKHSPVDSVWSGISIFESNHSTVTLGKPIPLPKFAASVPAHSVLVMETALAISGFKDVINNVIEFPAKDCGSTVEIVKLPNGLIFQLEVKWEQLYQVFLDTQYVPNWRNLEDQPDELMNNQNNDDQQALSNSYLYDRPIDLEFVGERLVEVSSVYIGLNKEEGVYNVYGSFEVDSAVGNCKIYDKDESCAEKFTSGKTLSLEGPSNFCFPGDNLTMKLDLKVDGQEFCKGFIHWDEVAIPSAWSSRYLSSAIRGNIGYAVVYYSIFSDAVQGKVRVFFSASDDAIAKGFCDHAYVSGSLTAEYGDFDYEVYYDEEYYRSVLFKTTQECPTQLSREKEVAIPMSSSDGLNEIPRSSSDGVSGIPLLLSRPVVVVPVDVPLFVQVNLSVRVETTKSKFEDLNFSGEAGFEVGWESCWMVENQGYKIYMFVEWDTVMVGARRPKRSSN